MERTILQKNLLVRASTLNDSAGLDAGAGSRSRESALYVDWPVGTVSGKVKVETATHLAYGGNWAAQGTEVTFAGTAPKQDVVQITGTYLALRTRVSEAVVGGAGVSTVFVSN